MIRRSAFPNPWLMLLIGLLWYLYGLSLFYNADCYGQGTFDAWKPKQIEASSQLCCEGGACLKIAGQPVDAHGYGWYKVKMIRGTAYQGMAGEVASRSKRWDSGRSVGAVCHESTHFLNSQIRNELGRKKGQESAYVPGGFALLIPRCQISLISIAPPGSARVSLGYYWMDGTPVDAASLVDEYSAYVCGSEAYVSYGTKTDAAFSIKKGRATERHLRRLRDELARRGYNYVHRIDELLAYGGAYLANLERGMNR